MSNPHSSWPDWLVNLFAVLGVALAVAGVAFIYWPAALILAGVLFLGVALRLTVLEAPNADS